MPSADFKTKLTQFNEFFSIEHPFSVNISLIDSNKIPDNKTFIQQIPLPFKIASDIVTLDQTALKPLQNIGNSANQLVEYLHHQTKKIDLLVGYIISQQDNEQQRFQGIKFGGGGIIFKTTQHFNLGDILELKIFLQNNTYAVYCIGEIIEYLDAEEKEEKTTKLYPKQYKVVFHLIREEDREALVRNSLHEQSKQLQALTKQRANIQA